MGLDNDVECLEASLCRFGDRRDDIVYKYLSMVDQDGIRLFDCAVRSSVDDKLIAVNDHIGIKAWREAIEWFVACTPEELRGRYARLEAVGNDHNVGAYLFLDAAQEDIV
jgi:hypothetical protein